MKGSFGGGFNGSFFFWGVAGSLSGASIIVRVLGRASLLVRGDRVSWGGFVFSGVRGSLVIHKGDDRVLRWGFH